MLNIFTDNWMKLPTLRESEHMYRIYTNNPMNVLYTITDLVGDELEDEVRFSLRRKLGKAVRLVDIEDVSCIIYEEAEAKERAEKAADDAWEDEGYYIIGWSDGGMDWTSNGPVWFESKSDLADELFAACDNSTETHVPIAEKVAQFEQYELDALLGDFKDDFDVEGIIAEATKPCNDGNRYWVVEGDELNAIIKSYEK